MLLYTLRPIVVQLLWPAVHRPHSGSVDRSGVGWIIKNTAVRTAHIAEPEKVVEVLWYSYVQVAGQATAPGVPPGIV